MHECRFVLLLIGVGELRYLHAVGWPVLVLHGRWFLKHVADKPSTFNFCGLPSTLCGCGVQTFLYLVYSLICSAIVGHAFSVAFVLISPGWMPLELVLDVLSFVCVLALLRQNMGSCAA